MLSTIKRHSYRFEGGADALARARVAIEVFKTQHADCDGYGQNHFEDEPEVLDGDSMAWSYKSMVNWEGLKEAIVGITDSTDLRCFAYWGTTDGQHYSTLEIWESGGDCLIASWPAEIGIDAAMAIDVLSNSDSVEALLVLFDSFPCSFEDGWSEVDFPWLSKAGIIGSNIMAVVIAHPYMVEEDARVRKALVKMRRPLMVVRRNHKKIYGDVASEGIQEMDQLIATIEAMALDDTAPASQTAKASKKNLEKAL